MTNWLYIVYVEVTADTYVLILDRVQVLIGTLAVQQPTDVYQLHWYGSKSNGR